MIVAAAIRKDGITYSMPKPARHHTIIHAAPRLGSIFRRLIRKSWLRDGEQGFLTDKGDFLKRVPAGIHAERCGQVHPGIANIQHEFNPVIGLFSEDLW